MTALEDRIDALVLRSNSRDLELKSFHSGSYKKLRTFKLNARLKAFPHRSTEYDQVVADWLVRYGVELLHIRHIAWHSLGLIDVAKALGIPVVFSFHDFYAVCPSVNLLDDSDRNCGGKCTSTKGECSHPLWHEPEFPTTQTCGNSRLAKNIRRFVREVRCVRNLLP